MTSLELIAKGIKDYKDQSLTDEEKRREQLENRGYVFEKPLRLLATKERARRKK